MAKDTVVVGWGRMNPPTTGHEKLVRKLKSVARQNRADAKLFLTHSQDSKKNPLSYSDKVYFARKAFGDIVTKSRARTIIEAMKELQRTYQNVVVVVGGDRVREFDTLLSKYNGKDYTFNKIEVVSAGERDPDATDVTGMSASKMRALAAQGDFESFKKGLPRSLARSANNARLIYDGVRKNMSDINEEFEKELNEASEADTRPKKRYHKLIKNKKPMIDKRFKMFKNKKVEEAADTPQIDAIKKRHKDKRADMKQKQEREMDRAKARVMRKNIRNTFTKDQDYHYNEATVIEDLIKARENLKVKAEKVDIAFDILEQVFERGLSDYEENMAESERSPIQYAYDRVNSFIEEGAAREMDSDLWEQHLVNAEFEELDEKLSSFELQRVKKKMNDDEVTYKQKQALDALDRLVKSKKDRQSIEGHAFTISRSYNVGMSARELARKYREMYSEEVDLEEKAKSKAQQRFMGMVHATKKGKKAPSKEVADAAKSMSDKDAEDFAKTKHKGKPEHVKEEFKKGDVVIAKKGPHKGDRHEVIHAFGDGTYNIRPLGKSPKMIRYALGAAKAKESDIELAEEKKDPCWKGYKQRGMKKKNGKKVPNCIPEETLEEGVNDPAIFKAVFLAGGAGSGKSFIVGKSALTAFGFKIVNSDNAFERNLKKAGLDPKNPDHIWSAEGQAIRNKSKAFTSRLQSKWLEGRLGLVIDGTGKDPEKMRRQAKEMQDLGYDVAMIFVHTELETSIKRDAQRDRSVGVKGVTKIWNQVQSNRGDFRRVFGNQFYVVDNSEGVDITKDVMNVYRSVGKWAKQPPQNPMAKKWIAQAKAERGVTEGVLEPEEKEAAVKRARKRKKELATQVTAEGKVMDMLRGYSKDELKKKIDKMSDSQLRSIVNSTGKKDARRVLGPKDYTMWQLAKDRLNENQDFFPDVLFKAKAKDGGHFFITKRDTKGMRGSQDKFLMKVVKDGKTKSLGSHPSLEGAKKFAKRRGIIEEVTCDGKGGAGEQGTDKLVKRYKKDTPGQNVSESVDASEKSALVSALGFGGAAEPDQKKVLDNLEKRGLIANVQKTKDVNGEVYHYKLTPKGRKMANNLKKGKDVSEATSMNQRKLAMKLTNRPEKKDKNDTIKKAADLLRAKEKLRKK